MQRLPVNCEICKNHELLWGLLPADKPEQRKIQEVVLKLASDREFISGLGPNHLFKMCSDCFDAVTSDLLGKAEGVTSRIRDLKKIQTKEE